MLNLKLRKFREEDFEGFHAAMSDYEVVKMTASWPWPPEPEFTRNRMNTPEAQEGLVNVIDLDGRYIGSIALIRGEIGYGVAKEYWGKGVASWAVAQKIAAAFQDTDIELIKAGVWKGNPASEAVLLKNGFVKTGNTREYCKPRGKELDSHYFELTRADWLKR